MKVSTLWLKQYLDNLPDVNNLKSIFTSLGLAVDSIEGGCFTLDVTSNRPDCLSIIGIARELAWYLNSQLKEPPISINETSEDVSKCISVDVKDRVLCPRYTARIVKGVKIASSPAWLQELLISVGIKPINNIVDITNFVLMECGQPLHAFDLKLLQGNRIIVRTANPGEKITAIDGKEYVLLQTSFSELVIADAK